MKNLYDEEQIQRIKNIEFSSTGSIVQAAAIDALREYGRQAIDTIYEVVNSPIIDRQIRTYGLKIIKELSVDEIERTQEAGIHSAYSKGKIEIIDILAVYRNKAILPIFDIMGSSTDQRVKTYGYNTIQKIRTNLAI